MKLRLIQKIRKIIVYNIIVKLYSFTGKNIVYFGIFQNIFNFFQNFHGPGLRDSDSMSSDP